jgi:hypothetical protein
MPKNPINQLSLVASVRFGPAIDAAPRQNFPLSRAPDAAQRAAFRGVVRCWAGAVAERWCLVVRFCEPREERPGHDLARIAQSRGACYAERP